MKKRCRSFPEGVCSVRQMWSFEIQNEPLIQFQKRTINFLARYKFRMNGKVTEDSTAGEEVSLYKYIMIQCCS